MRMSLAAFGLITLALAVALAAPVAGQNRPGPPEAGYRSGMPAVNAAPPAVDPDAGNHGAAGAF